MRIYLDSTEFLSRIKRISVGHCWRHSICFQSLFWQPHGACGCHNIRRKMESLRHSYTGEYLTARSCFPSVGVSRIRSGIYTQSSILLYISHIDLFRQSSSTHTEWPSFHRRDLLSSLNLRPIAFARLIPPVTSPSLLCPNLEPLRVGWNITSSIWALRRSVHV